MTEFFPALEVSREDIKDVGFSTDIDDATLRKVALKLGDFFLEYGDYREFLTAACEMCDVPRNDYHRRND